MQTPRLEFWTLEQWTILFEALSEGLVIQDLSGQIVAANGAAQDILGLTLDQLRGRTSVDARWRAVHEDGSPFPGEEHPAMLTLVSGVATTGVIMGIEAPNQGLRWLQVTAVPLRPAPDAPLSGVASSFLDITNLRNQSDVVQRLQDQLQQNQKFEAIGYLAAGIAHDFNNLLGAFSANLEVLKLKLTRGDVEGSLGTAGKAQATLVRARALSNQLLTFAKGGEPSVTAVALGPFLKETTAFALSGSMVVAVFDWPDDLPRVRVDRLQMAQVVDNLVINSLQAMGGGGTLTIRAQRWPENPEFLVAVQFTDTGPGIPADRWSTVFQPFFTTKPSGSGLGLATARRIALRHEGDLRIVPGPGPGATFELLLPVALDDESPPGNQTVDQVRYRGRVLVLDDEAGVREALVDLLNHVGFEAVGFADGARAFQALVAPSGGPWDLALLDLTIPGSTGGAEVARQVRLAGVETPLVAISGYHEDVVLGHASEYGFDGALAKPFTLADLVRVLGVAAPATTVN